MKTTKEEDMTASFSWWQDSHSRPPKSSWLQAMLSDLDEKTKVMVSIIDQNDGDSFALRAEMFYMRRPELVGTIHDLHRYYGSLARRYKKLANPVLNVENYSSSSSYYSSSPAAAASATENGRRNLGFDEIKSVSEEKLEVEIADTRLRVSKLAEGNLYEQAGLMRTNNGHREAIRLFCTRVQPLVDEHFLAKSRPHVATLTTNFHFHFIFPGQNLPYNSSCISVRM